MKKNYTKNREARVKVAKLKNNAFENGIVIFIAMLLATNFIISMNILFG